MLLIVLASLVQQDPMVTVVRPVVPRVHVISGFANGNILAVEGDDQVFLVDACWAAPGAPGGSSGLPGTE